MFNILRNCQNGFQNRCTTFHSHRQWMRVLTFPHPQQHSKFVLACERYVWIYQNSFQSTLKHSFFCGGKILSFFMWTPSEIPVPSCNQDMRIPERKFLVAIAYSPSGTVILSHYPCYRNSMVLGPSVDLPNADRLQCANWEKSDDTCSLGVLGWRTHDLSPMSSRLFIHSNWNVDFSYDYCASFMKRVPSNLIKFLEC